MVSVSRFTEIKNTSNPGAINKNPYVNGGNNWATEVPFRHKFIAAEVGTAAGQTRDTTSNPTTGFLFAKWKGPPIQLVVNLELVKDTAVTNANNALGPFRAFVTGTADKFAKLAYRVDNSVEGESSLYIIDQGNDTATQIAAGDTVIAIVGIGHK